MSETRQQRRARHLRLEYRRRSKKATLDAVIYHAASLQSAIEEVLRRVETADNVEALRLLKVAAQLEAKLAPYLFSMGALRDSVIRRNASKSETEAVLQQQFEAMQAGRYRPWEETWEEAAARWQRETGDAEDAEEDDGDD